MDEALTGGAPAPVEPTVSAPEPQVSTPAAEPAARKPEVTPRSAIDRAFAAVDKQEAPAEAKPVEAQPAPGERARNPDGTFKAAGPNAPEPVVEQAKPVEAPKPTQEPPSRFSPDAKAVWKDAPEAVRAEVARMEREMSAGLEKYRGDAVAFEPFRPFAEMASRNGVDAAAVLQNYVGIDTLLSQDFDAGIRQIFQNKGIDLKSYAAKITGQPGDPQADGMAQLVQSLRAELATIKQSLGGVTQTMEQTQKQQIGGTLQTFVQSLSEADQTLFGELDAEIAAALTDPSVTLSQAFATAKQNAEARYTRMFGARAQTPAPAAVTPPPPTPAPQTRNLQITGAPGASSNLATRKTPSSAREAIDSAFAAAGL